MTTISPMQAASREQDDMTLVSDALAGNRSAFGQIVARYQTLICSLAYSATGSIAQSEDLAQDTFLTAWKQLPHLRERGKLRAWLCGIARFTISNALRKQGREPSHAAESLEVVAETSTPEAAPAERAISSEEQTILWRAIARIPQTYREPLVLFYREQNSIETVARALELSEDAVKQRLSRGRKLLQEEVLAMVEGGLARTAPGRAFTVGVLAALPAFLLPAQAAVAAGTLSASGTTKTALGGSGLAGAFAGPLLAIFGTWVGYRMDLDSAGSDAEREFTKAFYRRLVWVIGTLFVAVGLLTFFAERLRNADERLLVGGFVFVGLAYAVSLGTLMLWWVRTRRTYLADQPEVAPVVKPAWEYLSRAMFCGLPLVHIRIGGDMRANRRLVRAWIAVGDSAFGGLFAFGGIAVAPISIGGCAIGLLPFGGSAIGLVALGGFSLGVWSFGGLAFGWQAFGGCAIAWSAAAGGAAIAHDFALGAHAYAAEANNAAARAFIAGQAFFRHASYVFSHYLAWLNLIWVIPMLVWWWLVRRAKVAASQV